MITTNYPNLIVHLIKEIRLKISDLFRLRSRDARSLERVGGNYIARKTEGDLESPGQ